MSRARDWRTALIAVIEETRANEPAPRGSAATIDTLPGVPAAPAREPAPDDAAPPKRAWRGAMLGMIHRAHGGSARRQATALLGLAMLALAACSSLVDDPCADGYMLSGNACVPRISLDGGGVDRPTPDGPVSDGSVSDGPVADGPLDGPVADGPLDGPVADGPLVDAPQVDAPPDALVDASLDGLVDAPVVDAPPDAPICPAPTQLCAGACTDVLTDPDNCGTCGHVCASGICINGVCAGELAGHIVAIGHDYQQHNAAMARLLGNAAALASTEDLGIAHLAGTASGASRQGTVASLASALAAIGRTAHAVALPADGEPLTGVDVLVIDAQTGDGATAEALGVQWKPAIDVLLARHGVVIVIEGVGGVSHRFAAGAGLFTVATPVDTTGSPAFVAAASDAVVQQVPSPYLADTTSVVFPAVVGAIATPSGTVVLHLTR